MSRATRVLEDPGTRTRIQVSRLAQLMIGHRNFVKFTQLLRDMMVELGVENAYVNRRGAAVEISLIRADGWRAHMKLKRGGGHE